VLRFVYILFIFVYVPFVCVLRCLFGSL